MSGRVFGCHFFRQGVSSNAKELFRPSGSSRLVLRGQDNPESQSTLFILFVDLVQESWHEHFDPQRACKEPPNSELHCGGYGGQYLVGVTVSGEALQWSCQLEMAQVQQVKKHIMISREKIRKMSFALPLFTQNQSMKWSLEEDWNIFHTPNTKDNTPSLHCNSNSTYSKQCWCLESAPLVREGVHPRAVAMTSITTRETPAMRIQRLKEEQRQKEKGTAPAPPRLETMQEFLPPPANLFAPPKEEENKVGSKRKAEEKKKTEKKSQKKEKAVKKKDKKKDKKDKKKKKDKKGKKKKKKSDSSSSDSSDSSSSWRIYSMAEALEDRRRQSSAVKKLQMLRWLAIESVWRYRGWHPIIFRYRCSQRDLAKHAYKINLMMMMMMVVMMMMIMMMIMRRKRKDDDADDGATLEIGTSELPHSFWHMCRVS